MLQKSHEPAQSCSGSPSVALAAETRADKKFPSLTSMILQLQTRGWWVRGFPNQPCLMTRVPQTESRTATFSDSPSSTTGSCGSQHGKKHFAPALAATARCMNGNVSHKSKSKPPSNVCMWSKIEGYLYIYSVCLFIYFLFIYLFIIYLFIHLFIYLLILYIYIYISSKLSLEHLLLASMV